MRGRFCFRGHVWAQKRDPPTWLEAKPPRGGSKREAGFSGGGGRQVTRGRGLGLPGGWAGRPEAGPGGPLPVSAAQVPLSVALPPPPWASPSGLRSRPAGRGETSLPAAASSSSLRCFGVGERSGIGEAGRPPLLCRGAGGPGPARVPGAPTVGKNLQSDGRRNAGPGTRAPLSCYRIVSVSFCTVTTSHQPHPVPLLCECARSSTPPRPGHGTRRRRPLGADRVVRLQETGGTCAFNAADVSGMAAAQRRGRCSSAGWCERVVVFFNDSSEGHRPATISGGFRQGL